MEADVLNNSTRAALEFAAMMEISPPAVAVVEVDEPPQGLRVAVLDPRCRLPDKRPTGCPPAVAEVAVFGPRAGE